MQKRVPHKHLPRKAELHNHAMGSPRVSPRPRSRARLENERQGELVGQYPSLEHAAVEAERFLRAAAVAAGSDDGVVQEPVRFVDSVEQAAGVAERGMPGGCGERAVGGEELRRDGGGRERAVDEEEGVDLVEALDGAALAQQFQQGGGGVAGGDRGRGRKHRRRSSRRHAGRKAQRRFACAVKSQPARHLRQSPAHGPHMTLVGPTLKSSG